MNRVLERDLEEVYKRIHDWDKLKGKSILLTGPYGMLASYIVWLIIYLNDNKGYNIKLIAAGRSSERFYGKFGEEGRKPYIEFIESELDSPIEYAGKVDYIIHAASFASPNYYEVCPVDVIRPNVMGTFNLLKLAAEKSVEGFLYFSSADIYGKVQTTGKVTESDCGVLDTLDIHNCYSESKRMGETLCKAFAVQYGVPVKMVRIWHTYAPTMNIEKDPRVFASFVSNIVKNENIEMKSDGSGRRCFCYITDALAAYMTVLLKGNVGEAYNVCNEGAFVSILELADILVNLFPERGLKVIRKERDKNEAYSENVLLKNAVVIPSSEKLQALGWKPEVTIQDGFRRVIEYIEDN